MTESSRRGPMPDRESRRRLAVEDGGFVPLEFTNQPTVLVVDDEELIRDVSTMMIEDYGGKVIQAANGAAAIEIFKEKQAEIDVVFLDFSMPGINGYETLLEIRKLKPGQPTVMVSGLRLVPEVEELWHKGEVEFLSKPFHESELIKAIHKLTNS